MPFVPRIDAEALRKAQTIAQAIVANVPADRPGFRLVWMRNGATGWCDLPMGGKPAVLGTHPNCDGVLKGEPGFSLRHLLAMTVHLDDGPALRILDLHTEFPFALEDGAPRRSIVTSGSVAIALGAYSIVGLPIAHSSTGRLEVSSTPSLPPLITESSEMPHSIRSASSSESTAESNGPQSRVTSMPASAELGSEGFSMPSDSTSDASVMVVRHGQVVKVKLSEQQLGLGVMIGRGVRCIATGVDQIQDVSISRTHLLLLAHSGKFEAFDVCSTQGTYMEGQRVIRQVLPTRAMLKLATVNPVIVHWKQEKAGL